MPELNELDMCVLPPILYGRADPDDQYPHPEPLDPEKIDKHKYEFEYDYEDEEDEDDESNYSS